MRELSLDDKIGKDRDTPISDFLEDKDLTSAEDDLLKREASTLVTEALEHLTHQERTVIGFRFGLETGKSRTLKEIGLKMGISRERVRQIECQAKMRLRKLFARRRMAKAPVKEPLFSPGGPIPLDPR
jgi:RNA polymerase primary sigma factor